MNFDYLRDEAPEAIERVLILRAHPEARAMASVLTIAMLVLLSAWVIGDIRVREERSSLAQARTYLAHSSIDADKVLARARHLRAWLSLDRRIRAIRISGAATARSIAAAANTLPLDAWLTSIRYDGTGYSVMGRAVGLGGVADALHAYRSIRLIAAGSPDARTTRVVDFEAYVSDR